MAKVDKDTVVRWEAEEYLQQDHNAGWYVGLIAVGLAFVALSVWLRMWSFTAVIVLSVIAIIIFSVRPPRKISYTLTTKGLTEGEQFHPFENYKSFGIIQNGTHFSIVLTPHKRFAPAMTVYFPENKGEEIVDMFGARLPMQEVKLDMIDKLVKWLRI